MLSGLPGSGKSTKAKEIVAQGNWIRVNRDLLRTMLHFDKFTGRNEGMTVDVEKSIARTALVLGSNVVVDDTNLNPKNKEMWKSIAKDCNAQFEHIHINTSPQDCINRDIIRHNSVGREVILNMALQSGIYEHKSDKGFVLCDLDGTLCDIKHRLCYVKVPEGEKKDWKKFFDEIRNDTPRPEVVELVNNFAREGHPIIFVSARPDTYKAETTLWLLDNFKAPYFTLIMRSGQDKRPDTEVKREMYEKYFKNKYPVHTVIDDRPSVIRMWREEGLNVIDVGGGVEF